VPDLGCIADVLEPSNPSGQFSVWFDEPSKGAHYPTKRPHLVSCVRIHLADTLLNVRCSSIIFSAEMTLRLSSAAVSRSYLRELCDVIICPYCTWHANVNIITDGRHKNEHTTQIYIMWAWNSSHPCTQQQVCDEFQHCRHLLP